MSLLNALPGAVAQGLIWGIMAIGLYITYKVLDFADLTVDGSMVTGAAVCAIMVTSGINVWVAMLCALLAGAVCGLITGIFHTLMGIPAICREYSRSFFCGLSTLKFWANPTSASARALTA